MKVKDFLEWFSDFDPESELKFDLFEEKINGCGDYEEFHTALDAGDVNYLDETDTVFVTLEWGDQKMLIVDMTEQTRDELLKDIKNIQSDIWDLKTKDITELEGCIDDIESRLETFISDQDEELREYEE